VRIHGLASFRHYERHVKAVLDKIDPDVRGEERWGARATTRSLPRDDVVLVGGFYDIERVPENRVIYVEHGAGQSYGGDEATKGFPAYSGGCHDERVIGYVCPNQRVADSWGRPAVAAGCPALDRHDPRRNVRWARDKVVVFTFHWDAIRFSPEARSARDHYIDDLHSMVNHVRNSGMEVLGTSHPRDTRGPEIWRNLQVEYTPDPDEVLERCHLLVADNTSLMYEAAKLSIPVVALNAPWYRRDVHHGLRFWDRIPGRQVDNTVDFLNISLKQYIEHLGTVKTARTIGDWVYPVPVGQAAEVAARWVEKLVAEQV
jgi:hypothetical protein